jgi:hypothetical protein
MTVEFRELLGSREFMTGSSAHLTLRFAVGGESDALTVAIAVRNYAPLVYADLVRGAISCKPQGEDLWFADVNYGLRKAADEDVAEWSFTISESSQHITHSLSTVSSYPGNAPDFKQALNVTGTGADKVVEGAEVGMTVFDWSETLYLPFTSWTPTYCRRLYNTQGRYNDAKFRIWAAGEVLLKLVTGGPHGQSVVRLDFSFGVEPNVSGRQIGDITGIDKKGWEYLWVFSEMEEDTDAHELCPQPKGVYVEQTRYSANFAQLGLPDPFA